MKHIAGQLYVYTYFLFIFPGRGGGKEGQVPNQFTGISQKYKLLKSVLI